MVVGLNLHIIREWVMSETVEHQLKVNGKMVVSVHWLVGEGKITMHRNRRKFVDLDRNAALSGDSDCCSLIH